MKKSTISLIVILLFLGIIFFWIKPKAIPLFDSLFQEDETIIVHPLFQDSSKICYRVNRIPLENGEMKSEYIMYGGIRKTVRGKIKSIAYDGFTKCSFATIQPTGEKSFKVLINMESGVEGAEKDRILDWVLKREDILITYATCPNANQKSTTTAHVYNFGTVVSLHSEFPDEDTTFFFQKEITALEPIE